MRGNILRVLLAVLILIATVAVGIIYGDKVAVYTFVGCVFAVGLLFAVPECIRLARLLFRKEKFNDKE